jgi:hypothetical protein
VPGKVFAAAAIIRSQFNFFGRSQFLPICNQSAPPGNTHVRANIMRDKTQRIGAWGFEIPKGSTKETIAIFWELNTTAPQSLIFLSRKCISQIQNKT